VAGIDMCPLATETYSLNNPHARVYPRRLEGLTAKSVGDDLGRIDLLLASPECTNHSVAKGNGERDERSQETAFHVVRFARRFEPRWIVVENVVAMKHWTRYAEWLEKLKALGYEHLTETTLDAQDFGVPQSRKRLFIICDREGPPNLPRQRPGPKTAARAVLQTQNGNGIPWRFTPLERHGRAEATIERADRAIDALGKRKEFIMVYYGTDGAGGWQTLQRPLRTITTLDRFALVRPNGKGHEMRMLQPPELAIAMGFPSDYKWPASSRRDKIRLLGNAVCPPVMKAIVESLTKNL
jgi:DNA (cytosine-5)-methyltransferase 1